MHFYRRFTLPLSNPPSLYDSQRDLTLLPLGALAFSALIIWLLSHPYTLPSKQLYAPPPAPFSPPLAPSLQCDINKYKGFLPSFLISSPFSSSALFIPSPPPLSLSLSLSFFEI